MSVSPEMELAIAKASAAVLGTKAFLEGRRAIPALDKDFCDFLFRVIKGKPIGYGIPIYDAYTSAWHQANAAAPLTNEAA